MHLQMQLNAQIYVFNCGGGSYFQFCTVFSVIGIMYVKHLRYFGTSIGKVITLISNRA